MKNSMLRLEDISVDYATVGGYFRAVNQVSLTVREHETFALVGASGCGKTTLARSLFGLLPQVHRHGAAWLNGMNLFAASREEIRRLLGREVGIVFQNPYHAFDPVYRIGDQINETLSTHLTLTRAEKRIRINELLDAVGLTAKTAGMYPHELSGGMLQRAQLAVALCCRPYFLMADEPTSSLDVTVQAQIIDLLNQLKSEKKLTLFIITHDLGVVAALADSVAVMDNGKIVENGPASTVLSSPAHPFTQQLVEADLAYR